MSSYSQTVTIQEILWQNANSKNAEYRKIQSKIKQQTDVNVSIESIKHMVYFYSEIQKTQNRQKGGL